MEEKWTADEITNYQKNYKKEKLGPVYVSAKIPKNDPSKRVEFLLERLNIFKDVYIKIAENNGKPYALARLENIAITNFF
ncbi:MAG: hypothetical protein AABY06_03160 [Nanoarchaeota archaeon]